MGGVPSPARVEVAGWLRYVAISWRRPRLVLGGWAVTVAVSLLGISQLDIDTTTASFLDRRSEAWAFYQQSVRDFAGDEFLTIAIEGSVPYAPTALALLVELSERLDALPGVRRVDSLSTVPLIGSNEKGFIAMEPALARGLPRNEAEVEALARRIERDRTARGALVSDDGRVFAINVVFDGDIDGDRDRAVHIAEEMLAGKQAWISGVPVFRTKVNERTGTELAVFVPITLLLVALVIGGVFQSIWAVLIAFLTAGAGAALAFGVMGFLHIPVSLSTAVLPSVLLALGCAYSMHVFFAVVSRRGSAGFPQDELLAVAPAVALSGLTTVIGFLAMTTVGVTAIRELATVGAIGVFASAAAALSLAPTLLYLRPIRSQGAVRWRRLIVEMLHMPLHQAPRGQSVRVIWAWLLVLGVSSAGLAWLRVETDIILWFPRGTEIRESYEAIRSRLSGISPLNVVVESTDEGVPLSEPMYLRAIEKLCVFLERRPEVGHAMSVVDLIGPMHRAMAGTKESIPATRAQVEQYLVMLEQSSAQLGDVMSFDRQRSNVLVRADVNGSRALTNMAEIVEAWWGKHGPAGSRARVTGIMYEFGRAEEEIARGQLRGLGLAFGAVGIILVLLLRSGVAAVLALVPNLIPIAMAYGVMGLVRIPLDAATVCLGSIALGIGVDDTIHIVMAVRRSNRDGQERGAVVDEGLRRVLPPIVLTTLAIVVGFLVLGMSEFTLVRNFGFVTAGMMAACLIADVTLLPVLLVRAGGRWENATSS